MQYIFVGISLYMYYTQLKVYMYTSEKETFVNSFQGSSQISALLIT